MVVVSVMSNSNVYWHCYIPPNPTCNMAQTEKEDTPGTEIGSVYQEIYETCMALIQGSCMLLSVTSAYRDREVEADAFQSYDMLIIGIEAYLASLKVSLQKNRDIVDKAMEKVVDAPEPVPDPQAEAEPQPKS